eukprot:TRINITY_DN22899_c0_g1_i1.p1 TRINITY_DN22899_c0_g1~~TRINITY_DN22899_c0_g1_i1.p1  ORF type:complete len:455 (+),score=41.96 TRINITY_DN22899_c0_g1_i1:76-1365(+)
MRRGGGARGRGSAAAAGNALGRGGSSGNGRGKGPGRRQGARPAAAAAGRGQLAQRRSVLAVSWDPLLVDERRPVAPVPGLLAAPPVAECADMTLDYCGSDVTTFILGSLGQVDGVGANACGQLGVGDSVPRRAFARVRLPWAAASVRCGKGFCVALRRGGGAVCSWGRGCLGRDGGGSLPAEVQGLPAGDPVVLIDAARHFAAAVTQSGEVYGWGDGFHGTSAVRITELCGSPVRRIACGPDSLVAETCDKQLLCWEPAAAELERCGRARIAFPLRSLGVGRYQAAAADAKWRLWCKWYGDQFHYVRLPRRESVVRVASAGSLIVAVTVWGCLWDCRHMEPRSPLSLIERTFCRRISVGRAPPLVRLPWGGSATDRILLVPDLCCGLPRTRLLLLAAGRRRLLPGGEMVRSALALFLVDEEFIVEKSVQ